MAEEDCPDAVALPVARIVLWTRRWRSTAEDGTVVAVALEKAAQNQDVLLGGDRSFRIAQMAEEVVVNCHARRSPPWPQRLAGISGIAILPIEVREKEILLESFPTLTDSLDRIGIAYSMREDILNCRPHSEHTH